uniref:Uncharacterized protein n=1 Tax=Callorhinchus milii TaxID=7868 RepID=A0A4W3H8Z4_CALMI
KAPFTSQDPSLRLRLRSPSYPFPQMCTTDPNLTFLLQNLLFFPSDRLETKFQYNKEFTAQITLQELILYLVFLLTLSVLTFGMVNSNMYFFTKVMSNLFLETKSSAQLVNFKKIRSMEDFWEFAEGPLLDSLYWKEWYDGQPLSSKESYIYYENILLGVPQIRQVRVRNNTCSVLKYFRDTFKDCFNEYSLANEDHSAFGLQTGSEWEYTVPNSQFELRHWGKISKYRNGGYILDLDRQKEESAKKIKHLKSNLWLDLGSRAVFIDFSVYNANVNLFCALRLLVEFPATGGATTSWHIYTVKLLRYVSTLDYFLGACEILFCLFILNYLGQELIEMYELKLRYFQSFWNCLDFLIVLLSLLAIVFSIYRTAKVSLVLEKLLENSFKYPNLYFLAYWQNQYNNMIAITVFIAWIKIFKFISFNETMTQLATTLQHCAKDIAGFAIMFFIIFFGYAQLGYLIFGAQVESFHTFSNCIFTQFRIILGDFNFAEIEKANRILGPIYFTTFVFCIFFVLLNVFLAIINETYAEVKGNRSLRKIDFDISDLIKKVRTLKFNKLICSSRSLRIKSCVISLYQSSNDKLKDRLGDGDLTIALFTGIVAYLRFSTPKPPLFSSLQRDQEITRELPLMAIQSI